MPEYRCRVWHPGSVSRSSSQASLLSQLPPVVLLLTVICAAGPTARDVLALRQQCVKTAAESSIPEASAALQQAYFPSSHLWFCYSQHVVLAACALFELEHKRPPTSGDVPALRQQCVKTAAESGKPEATAAAALKQAYSPSSHLWFCYSQHCVLAACALFELAHKRAPMPEDVPALRQQCVKTAAESGIPEATAAAALDAGLLADYLGMSEEMPPVNAVVGGVLANEVLKAVSSSGAPLKNVFFFDAHDGSGVVEDLAQDSLP